MAEEARELDMGTEVLTDALFELHMLNNLLNEARGNNYEITFDEGTILLTLVRILKKKIHYYQEKYGFRVPNEDIFHLEELPGMFSFGKEATGEEVGADE
jgi:hypothetical protein